MIGLGNILVARFLHADHGIKQQRSSTELGLFLDIEFLNSLNSTNKLRWASIWAEDRVKIEESLTTQTTRGRSEEAEQTEDRAKIVENIKMIV